MKQKGRFQGKNALLFTSYLGLGNDTTCTFFKTHDHQHFFPAARMALSHTDHMQAQCLETGMPFGLVLLEESLAFCPALNV